MRIAFYAPMKPPDHPIPSGDRRLARLFFELLGTLNADSPCTILLASRVQSWRPTPPGQREMEHLMEQMRGAARSLLTQWQRAGMLPDLWFTYHLYPKAPDWFGPLISTWLSIPYCVAEASLAAKYKQDAWAAGYQLAWHALQRADAVCALTHRDWRGLRSPDSPVLPSRLWFLPPFLEQGSEQAKREGGRIGETPSAPLFTVQRPCRLLTVAMMRSGAKLRSYLCLAQILAALNLPRGEWHLTVVGDGPARVEIQSLFQTLLPGDSCSFLGECSKGELAQLYCEADIFVWPAVEEAFGMAILEAQAAGLPVVAGTGRSVADIVQHGETGFLAPSEAWSQQASFLRRLITTPSLRLQMGSAARRKVEAEHSFTAARKILTQILNTLPQKG